MILRKRLFVSLILALPGFALAQAQPSSGPGWRVAGSLGLLQFVVVSGDRIRQREFYDEVIAARCPPDVTCFLRFITNSSGAPVAMPLADAILAEPAASFQRSAKQNNEVFEWSCRLGLSGNCF